MALCGGRGLPGLAGTSPGVSPLPPLSLDAGHPAEPGRLWDTSKRRGGGLSLPRLSSTLSPQPVASPCARDSVCSQPSDAGLRLDSLTQHDSAAAEEAFEKGILNSRRVLQGAKLHLRRIRSLPPCLLESSTILKVVSHSGEFNVCRGRVQRGRRESEDEEGFVPKKLPTLGQQSHLAAGHGAARRDALATRPCSTSSLLSDATMTQRTENVLTTRMTRKEEAELCLGKCSKCRQLFCSPSGTSRAIRPILKRGHPCDGDTPVKAKQHRRVANTPCEEVSLELEEGLQHSRSAQHEEIRSLLDSNDQELIGDFSKAHLLPMVKGKDPSLKYISPDTLVAVLTGQWSSFIESSITVDCRYPYEYEGGHIKGAVNLPLHQDVEQFLLDQPILPMDTSKRVIIIFHCEFSAHRGPKMCRFLREKDRSCHEYPQLHYPELYVLKGGYRDFFLQYPTHCEPQDYRPMEHGTFQEELRQFRCQSRLRAGECSRQEFCSRLLPR
ncbi:M-phase inducer phosphatase 2-like isoform X1 [Corapipo altera]|uniref:M-phase inducer phosphatase 2-like isoform X1 n=1 Tax=Corapipo altera TaxID=415028 RepID=UPI000FD6A494|nr:M-phase inducer phosphatase 2-like isoform X1 [Corapipo altera]